MFTTSKANVWYPFVIVMIGFVLLGSCAPSTGQNPGKVGTEYQEIKAISQQFAQTHETADCEKLVEKTRTFIKAYPKHRQVDEVYYLLGSALVQLERVEEAIGVFEELVKYYPTANYVAPCLLELGLAYDKLSKHDKANAVYEKLADKPKYLAVQQAQIARELLEQEPTERTGKLPNSSVSLPSSSAFIGKPAPDFQVTDLRGNPLSLEVFRGQIVLLDFWATWCPPCIAEIPNLKKTYQNYSNQNFEIIGISLDRGMAPLEAYIQQEGIAWPQFLDNQGKIASMYQVTAIPSTFLIDGDGIVRKTNLRGYLLETAVSDLLESLH